MRMGKTTSSLRVTTCTSPSASRSRSCSAPLDVLHDFYVPEFRAKMDMVPGMVTYFWMTPIRTGTFDVLCAELCGAAHAQMRAKVFVDDEPDYQAWLAKQKTFAELSGRSAVMKATYKSGGE